MNIILPARMTILVVDNLVFSGVTAFISGGPNVSPADPADHRDEAAEMDLR